MPVLPIIIDLGLALNSDPVQWVVEACSSAVSEGTCTAEATAGDPPRAVAIIRTDEATREVRIEIGIQRTEAEALWLTRRFAFSASDPVRERWRSVGLAVATLAGEIEHRAQDPQIQAGPSAATSADLSTSPDLATPPSRSEAAAEEPADRTPSPAAANEPDRAASGEASDADVLIDRPSMPSTPLDPQAWLLSLGGLAGLASEGIPRWGAGLQLAAPLAGGFQWSVSGSYSAANFSPFELRGNWAQLQPGLGYRVANGPMLASLNAHAGARMLSVSGTAEGQEDRQTAWRALVGGSADLWWLWGSGVGAWVSVAVNTSMAETRVVDARTERTVLAVPAWDGHGALGLFWSL